MSASDLAKKIGVNGQTVYDIESGKVQIKYGVLLKIKDVFPDLETGLEVGFSNPVGSVIKDFQEKTIKSSNKASLTNNQEKKDNTLIQVPEYDVYFSAGSGTYPIEHALAIGERSFDPIWLSKKGLKPKDLALVRVQGDSMEPLLKDKDIVMVDTSKTVPSEAMPFAIRFGEDLFIKTVQRLGNGSIALISRNKDYNDIVIDKNNPPEEFNIIGAVVWHAHSWV